MLSETAETVSSAQQLDISGLARMLGLTPPALRQRLFRDPSMLPPGYKLGRTWRWDLTTVQRWIAALTAATAMPASTPSLDDLAPQRHRRSRKMRKASKQRLRDLAAAAHAQAPINSTSTP